MSQSFETPEHVNVQVVQASTKFVNVLPSLTTYNETEGLLDKLKNWPNGSIINWSELAREFNIPGLNGRQTVKEFASENGFSVLDLDECPPKHQDKSSQT